MTTIRSEFEGFLRSTFRDLKEPPPGSEQHLQLQMAFYGGVMVGMEGIDRARFAEAMAFMDELRKRYAIEVN